VLVTVPEPEAPSTLPSWVADWSTTGKHIPLRLQGSSQEKYVHFAASANHVDYEPIIDVKKRLRLNGFLFDEVTALSTPVATRVLPKEKLPACAASPRIRSKSFTAGTSCLAALKTCSAFALAMLHMSRANPCLTSTGKPTFAAALSQKATIV